MFVEAFHSTIKGFHFTLEVKTSFDNSTPATDTSTESNSQKPGVPTDSHHRHRWKEEENLRTKKFKAKLEQLCSARLTRHDQAVNF
jgi:hypothetical protein